MADEMNVNTNANTNVSQDEGIGVNEDNLNIGNEGSKDGENESTVEELLTQIAKLKADGAKNKNALDRALKEKGEITKKLRERQSKEEVDAELKAAEEAERAEREAEKDRLIAEYEAKATFSELGLSGKFLEDALNAKKDNDEKSVYSVIAKFFEDKYDTALKAKESEWLGNRPPVNVGVGGSSTLTKAQFDKMGYSARLKLATENPTLYAQFTS